MLTKEIHRKVTHALTVVDRVVTIDVMKATFTREERRDSIIRLKQAIIDLQTFQDEITADYHSDFPGYL